jgi:probable rRNA maturation factor
VRVQNAQRKLRVDLRSLQEFAERALQLCLDLPTTGGVLSELAEVNVVLVSDRRIAQLHQKFMNLPGPTDVLTFEHGEIVISVETAQENAQRFKSSAEDEIGLYLVHGLLHLLGFDDRTAAQARAMEAIQAQIFRAAFPV